MKKLITLCCFLLISTTYAQLIAIDDVVVGRSDNPNPSTSNGPRIFLNDYLNGTAITFGTFGNFTFTESVPDPTGFTALNPLGFVNIAASTPQGIYYITYEVCENANPSNCDTAVIEIRIFPGTISSGSGSSEMAISASSGNVSCGGNVCITDPFCIDLNTGTIPPLTLSTTYQEIGASNTYTVNTIPFNPPFSFGDTATGTSLTTDDIWSPVINFAFDFEFYQANYSSCVLSTNGAVSFDLSNANTFHFWTPAAGALIPNNTDAALRNGNIFGAIHDTDPSASGTLGVNYNITYSIKGEAPFRVFVFSFYNVAHFACNSLKTSQMIMFYETTNIVETYVFQKPVCATWAGGRAAIGIQNNAGNQGISPPGRNTGVWDIPFLTPEAYQFVPSGTTITTFQWLDEAGTVIGTDPNALVVTPSQTTTYVAQVTYTDAITGVEYVAFRPITVVVSPTPVVTVTSSADICDTGDAVFTITGSENDIVEYNINGGATQSITIDATGTYVITLTGITTTQTINLLSANNLNSVCGGPMSVSETVNVIASPIADAPADVTACNDYTLPALTVGDYYTATGGPGGTGTMLNAGDVITTTQTIYVYAESGTTPNCFDENSFVVTINSCTLSVSATADMPSICDDAGADVTLTATPSPGAAVGVYSYSWTVLGNATVLGTNATLLLSPPPAVTTTYEVTLTDSGLTPPNDTVTNTVTVTVNATPTVDAPIDVTACDSYVLPALTSGNYYTGAGGSGTALNAGDTISSTQTIYVYEETGTTPNCFDENSFVVTINITPVIDAPTDVTACDSYTLPALTTGGTYYTGASGTGTVLNTGDVIATTQTIYVFEETGTTPNCFSENSFVITINTTPAVDNPADVTACNDYTLPALTNGTYYTGTGGTGTVLNAGDLITTTQTIYIYAETGTTPNCSDENSFVLTIDTCTISVTATADMPSICNDAGADVTLTATPSPGVAVGIYSYSWTVQGNSTVLGTNATLLLSPPPVATTIYEITLTDSGLTPPNDTATNTVTVTVNTTPTVDAPTDVTACDSYLLPALTSGNYYTGTGGTGTALTAGDTVSSTQTIYVYGETGTTPNCSDENSFIVTINTTPTVDAPADVIACDNYVLPALTSGNYYTGTGGTGTALTAGDTVSSTQTIYVYGETGTTPNCSDENSFIVTINTTPTVDAPADVIACDNYVLPALTSGNYYTGTGGTGTALTAGDTVSSTQTIYVYGETGTTPNCFDENSFIVTINTTPTVDAPADVIACDNYVLPALTSGNYYTGTGGTGTALAIGDTVSSTQTIYVYGETGTTPNCSDENSFIVTINTTPTVDAPADVTACDSYVLPALASGTYYTGTGGTGTVLAIGDTVSSTQTIYVYGETGTTPNCSDENSFIVTINTTPTVDTPADVIACDNYILPALTSGNYYTGTGGTGIALTAGDTVSSTQTIYVYGETGTTPNCSDENSFIVTINSSPVVDAPADVTICVSYTLPALAIGTYYTGTGGTGSVLNVGDVITSTQTIYVYTETGTTPNCSDENSFVITINSLPTLVNPSPLVSCDENIFDGMTEMDLTVKDNEITGGNTNYIVTYHNNLAAAVAGTPEVSPSSTAYIGTDGEIVFVRVEDSTTGCFDTTTLTLNVVTGPPVNTPMPLYDCDVDNDNLGSFDLSPVRDDILASDPTLVVTFHLTLQNALDDVNPQSDTLSNVAGQIIYVRVEFGSGIDCATIVELQLIVKPAPEVPDNISPYAICDDDSDGMSTFNLTTMDATIYGAQNPANFTLTYHESMADAESIPGMNPIVEPDLSNYVSGNTIIYVRLEGSNGCIKVGQFDLIVNPLPDIPVEAQDAIYEICDDSSDNDGYAIFDLTTQNDGLTGGDVTLDVNYFETMADIPNNPISDFTAYANVSIGGLPHNPQTIFVTVTETTSGSNCYALTSLTLVVNTLPTPNDVLPDLTVCDDNNSGDLQEEFDLTQNEGLMLNDFDETVTYHETLGDAESGDNPISNSTAYTNISAPQTIYVRVTNTGDPNDSSDDGTGCYAIITFDLIINPVPVFDIDDLYTICINLNGTEVIGNPIIDTGLNPSLYTFEWVEDGDPSTILGTDSTFMPTVEGNYTVTVTHITTQCMSSDSTVVQLSSPPTVTATLATEAFADNNIIQVTATGDGGALFEFSIDNGPWLSNEPNSNTYTFTNVLFGEHVIQARDINGCGIANDVVLVMDYPLFFTPNNDGYNDTWQIVGIENQFDAKIFIYDRYGKLLKQLSPTGPGWDGTYNGELLPSSDYWFTIEYRELGESEGAQKQFKAHFSLKR